MRRRGGAESGRRGVDSNGYSEYYATEAQAGVKKQEAVASPSTMSEFAVGMGMGVGLAFSVAVLARLGGWW